MRTEEDKILIHKLDEILKHVRETNQVVQEIKMWRKFIMWAFGITTVITTLYDFWKDIILEHLK